MDQFICMGESGWNLDILIAKACGPEKEYWKRESKSVGIPFLTEDMYLRKKFASHSHLIWNNPRLWSSSKVFKFILANLRVMTNYETPELIFDHLYQPWSTLAEIWTKHVYHS